MPVVNPTDFPIIAATTSGSDLADRLNRLFDAYESNQFNPQRPLQLQKGGLWTRAEQNGDMTLMFYDGANDHEIGSVSVGGSSLFGSGKPLALEFDITKAYKKDAIIYDKLTKTYYAAKADIAANLPFNLGDWNPLVNVFNEIHQQKDQLAKCHTGATPPPLPHEDGHMWYDTSDPTAPVFKVYHDGAWDTRGFGAPKDAEIDLLVVGGGGGGGCGETQGDQFGAGGGGGGGVYEGKATIPLGSLINITIGAGGGGGHNGGGGGAGGDTAIVGIVTAHGGAGGGSGSTFRQISGDGGASGTYTLADGTVGGGVGGLPGAHNAGGAGSGASGQGSGAPGIGASAPGGPGKSSAITGTPVTYAAGGSGSPARQGNNAAAANPSPRQPDNTGNGGNAWAGGAWGGNPATNNGQAGGSGVAILKIPTSSYTGKVTGNPSVVTVLAHTIITFTASGTYQA